MLKQTTPRHNNDFAYGPSRQRFVMHVGSEFGDLSSNCLPQHSLLSFQTKSLSFQCTHVIMHNNLLLLSSHNYLTLDGESRLDVHWCFYLSLLPKGIVVCVGVYLLSKTTIYLPKAKSLCILAQLPFKDSDSLCRCLDNKIVTSGSLEEAGNAVRTLISLITQFIQIYHAFPSVIYYISFPFLCFVLLLCFL